MLSERAMRWMMGVFLVAVTVAYLLVLRQRPDFLGTAVPLYVLGVGSTLWTARLHALIPVTDQHRTLVYAPMLVGLPMATLALGLMR